MQIKFKRLSPNSKIPCYALEHDAGMDVFSIENIIIKPGQRALVRTGIASEIEPGYVALVWDKSGIANNRGLKVLGGVIDAGYRGEWQIGLHNLSQEIQIIEPGDKVAQVIIQQYINPEIIEVAELSDSSRSSNGFGSTGK